MGCSQLIVLCFVLACVSLRDARPLGAGVPARWGVEVAAAGREPEREDSRLPIHRAARRRYKPTPQAVPWRFPEDPVEPVRMPPVGFKVELPEASNRVAVKCGENRIHVEVSQDLLGLGRLVKPEEITLGGCSAVELDEESNVLVFESELHGCNGKLVLTENAFIYAFMLVYNPNMLDRNVIMRSQEAVVNVECHYQRKSNVISGPLQLHSNNIEEQPYFSLRLMNADWSSETASNQYDPGEVLNMEASVLGYTRMPLKVLVDSCVAGEKPGFTSEPQHVFIKNHGCLGGRHSGSRFMHQSQPHQLQFQVAASSFHPLRLMFITCSVKAIPASSPITIENKACSFDNGTWRSVAGRDRFCFCCESTCEMKKAKHLHEDAFDLKWEAEMVLGPLYIQ